MIYEVTLSQTDADLHEKIRMASKFDPLCGNPQEGPRGLVVSTIEGIQGG